MGAKSKCIHSMRFSEYLFSVVIDNTSPCVLYFRHRHNHRVTAKSNMKTQSQMQVASPWGQIQHSRPIADGIIQVSTASHGGIGLSRERAQELKTALPAFRPFAGQSWLEEDCDAAVAPLVWPEAFPEYEIRMSVRIYLGTHSMTNSACVQQFLLRTPKGQALVAQADKWDVEHRTDWQVLACRTTGYGGWMATVRRVGDSATKIRWFKDYPDNVLYTEAELEEFTLSEAEANHCYRGVQTQAA